MRIRLIASDLDGTLLNEKKEIPPFTKETLFQAMERGICFVPATGRSFSSMPEEVQNLPGVEYVITSNGAAVYSVSEKRRVYECLLDGLSVDTILSVLLPEDMVLEAFVKDIPYTEPRYLENPKYYGATDYGEIYVRSTRKAVPDIRGFIRAHREELDSLSFVCADPEKILALKKELEMRLPGLYVTLSFAHMLEVGNGQAGKGKTLLRLLDMLGIPREEAMAFGDAHNDLDMLTSVAFGIAMENASEDCRRAAFAVTDSNLEDGVGKAIRKYADVFADHT